MNSDGLRTMDSREVLKSSGNKEGLEVLFVSLMGWRCVEDSSDRCDTMKTIGRQRMTSTDAKNSIAAPSNTRDSPGRSR